MQILRHPDLLSQKPSNPYFKRLPDYLDTHLSLEITGLDNWNPFLLWDPNCRGIFLILRLKLCCLTDDKTWEVILPCCKHKASFLNNTFHIHIFICIKKQTLIFENSGNTEKFKNHLEITAINFWEFFFGLFVCLYVFNTLKSAS